MVKNKLSLLPQKAVVKYTAYLLPSIEQHDIIFSQVVLSKFSWDLLNLKRILCWGFLCLFFNDLSRYSDFTQTKGIFKRLSPEAGMQFFLIPKGQALNWFDECVNRVSLKGNKSHNCMSCKVSSQFVRTDRMSSGVAEFYIVIMNIVKLGPRSARRRRWGNFHRAPCTKQTTSISWYQLIYSCSLHSLIRKRNCSGLQWVSSVMKYTSKQAFQLLDNGTLWLTKSTKERQSVSFFQGCAGR